MSFEDWKNATRKEGILAERAISFVYNRALNRDAPFSVIDGGAHAGHHTFQLSALPNCERVIAVEADPHTYARFEKLVRDRPDANRITAVQAAIQGRHDQKEVTFLSSDSHPGRSGIKEASFWTDDASVSFRPEITVPATTLDKLAEMAGLTTDFIKLDLEGGEYGAVLGGSEVMRNHRPLIVFENGIDSLKKIGKTPHDLFDMMTSRGYRILGFNGQELQPATLYTFWYAWMVPDEKFDAVQPHVKAAIPA